MSTPTTTGATRAEVCAAACADLFRGDGEIVAAAVAGFVPMLGSRLARATFAPDLLTTDGGPALSAEPVPSAGRPRRSRAGCRSVTTCGSSSTGGGTW